MLTGIHIQSSSESCEFYTPYLIKTALLRIKGYLVLCRSLGCVSQPVFSRSAVQLWACISTLLRILGTRQSRGPALEGPISLKGKSQHLNMQS